MRLRPGDVVIVGEVPDPNSGVRAGQEQTLYSKALAMLCEGPGAVAFVDMTQKRPTVTVMPTVEGAQNARKHRYRVIHRQDPPSNP